MRDRKSLYYLTSLSAVLIPLLGTAITPGAIAQTLPNCQPPASGEYLILVLNETDATPTQLQQTLPTNATTTVCNYLGRSVTRVGGFTDAETASSWVQYLTDIGGMEAFVARPPAAAQPVALPAASSGNGLPTGEPISTNPPATLPPAISVPPVTPAPIPSPDPVTPTPSPVAAATPLPTATTGFSPQPLGDGYAVLVDYFNRPELANQVQQTLARPVGLVSYNQRPYLLALYTSDVAIASQTLRTLSDRNFTAIVVDSRQTVLLTAAVALQ